MGIISEQRLMSALSTTARLIEAYGDAYWPIFDRLEQELAVLNGRKAKLKKYRSLDIHALDSSSFQHNLESQND